MAAYLPGMMEDRKISDISSKSGYWITLAGAAVISIYVSIMLVAAEGQPTAPLDDAYIHFQYARQMALGQPWQYNAGDPISTGATSLLYPFLLAVSYKLGFQGEAIVWPALLIGGVSLIISAILVSKITDKLLRLLPLAAAPGRSPIPFITALLFLFTGAISWVYLNGMESGLFTVFLLAALYTIVEERPGLSALFLILAALTRPEGLFLAGIAWMVTLGRLIAGKGRSRRAFGTMTLALALAGTPYLVNLALTGTPVATGAQAKSWFGNVPFILPDLLDNVRRMFLFILERMTLGFWASRPWPVAPGFLLLALAGAVALWRGGLRWLVVMLGGWFLAGSMLAATLITALWQIGRYQAPFAAILLPLVGVGMGAMLYRVRPRWRRALTGGLVLWAGLVGYANFQAWDAYYDAVASTFSQQVALGGVINDRFDAEVVVAVHDAGAIRYVGNRRTYDMIGLTTQGAADAWRQGSGAIFELMEQAANRPTHFATYPNVATIPYFADTALFAEELYVTEPYGSRSASTAGPVKGLYKADWTPAENKEFPQQEDMRTLISPMAQAMSLDLADLVDEKAKDMSWTPGRSQPGFPTEVRQFRYKTDPQVALLDGGRLISGQIAFPVTVSAHQDLLLIARVHAQEDGALGVTVDGKDAGTWRYPAAPGRWLETAFPISGALINESQVDITLQLIDEDGTALPIGFYHLWAYQGEPELARANPQTELGYQFTPHIILEGYDLAANAFMLGEDLPLTLYWTAEDPPDVDLKVFLHLYDLQGNLVAQVDQRPQHDTRPPYAWLPGEQIRDPYQLYLPPDLEPGYYDLALGMYDPLSNERVVITSPAGEILPEGRLPLDRIVVR